MTYRYGDLESFPIKVNPRKFGRYEIINQNIFLIILFSICLFAFISTRGHTISEDSARKSAEAEIVKFATERNLDLDLFSELKRIEINAPWGFSWSYEGEPRLEGGVNILNDGTSEIYSAPVEN